MMLCSCRKTTFKSKLVLLCIVAQCWTHAFVHTGLVQRHCEQSIHKDSRSIFYSSHRSRKHYSTLSLSSITREEGETKNYESHSTESPHVATKNTKITRREALISTAAFLTLSSIAPKASVASTLSDSTGTVTTLEDVNLGKGTWTMQNDYKQSLKSKTAKDLSTSLIPATFATYATRFLINYDEGLSTWWNEKKVKYSLLSSDEMDYKLGNAFGSVARSIQIGMEDFIAYDDTPSTATSMQPKFEKLATLFVEKYAYRTKTAETEVLDQEVARQIGLLFTILPTEYQPVKALKILTSASLSNINSINDVFSSSMKSPISNDPAVDNLTILLSSKFTSNFDSTLDAYTIKPSLNIFEIGVDNRSGQNAIATPFGPISETPLQRQLPDLSIDIYALFGISGAAGCALTHSIVIPFDVVKTRLQTNPDRYNNVVDGAVTIAKTEGTQALLLGAQATVAGYFWYGLSVYPSYSFFKWYFENSLYTPAYAAAHVNDIALIGGALAAVIASIGLTPLEAARIRTVAEPDIYRDKGLLGTMKMMSEEDPILGWRGLYAGFPSLLTRQVIFGSVKFLAFERACEAIFLTLPELRDSTLSALAVSLVAGAFSGALSSIVSQPADSVLTYVANSKTTKSGNLGITASIREMIDEGGASSLFRGLGSRCLWASCIISGQFFLYDIFRSFFGITTDDLSQTFELFIKSVDSSPMT